MDLSSTFSTTDHFVFLPRVGEVRFPATYYRGDDVFTHHLLDLIGLGNAGLANATVGSRYFVAALRRFGRGSGAIAEPGRILNGYFDVPVEVEQFAGAWYRLDPSAQCSMSDEENDSERLGDGVVVGDEIWISNRASEFASAP